MLVITKMRDGTYSLSDGVTLINNQDDSQVRTLCTWKYKIRYKILVNALAFCKSTGNDMIIFYNDTEYKLRKIDYSNAMNTDTSMYLK